MSRVEATLQGELPRYERGLREVGAGAWAWLQPNGSWGEANAGLVVGDGVSALIDTLWGPRLAREMLAAMAPQVAEAPIGLVVDTHSDGDHWWGNSEVPTAAEIVTSRASLDAMREEASPGDLARMRRLARLVAHLPGRPGAMGRYVGAMLAPFDFGDVELRLPDRAFAGTATEVVGGRELRLIEVGPAHTAGDLVVHVPDAAVVYAADVLFLGATPIMWAGPLENWIAALDLGAAADRPVARHVGLGVEREQQVEALRDYWRWLGEAVGAEHARGRSALEAARALTRDGEFARYAGWLCPERMVISVTTVHRALSGEGPVPASPPARARLFAQVARLGRELASR